LFKNIYDMCQYLKFYTNLHSSVKKITLWCFLCIIIDSITFWLQNLKSIKHNGFIIEFNSLFTYSYKLTLQSKINRYEGRTSKEMNKNKQVHTKHKNRKYVSIAYWHWHLIRDVIRTWCSETIYTNTCKKFYSCNSPSRYIRLWDVQVPTIPRQSVHRRWLVCQPYAPAALYPRMIF
jgi:hypothetical protein